MKILLYSYRLTLTSSYWIHEERIAHQHQRVGEDHDKYETGKTLGSDKVEENRVNWAVQWYPSQRYVTVGICINNYINLYLWWWPFR